MRYASQARSGKQTNKMNKRRLQRCASLLLGAICLQTCSPVLQKHVRKQAPIVQTLAGNYVKIAANISYQYQDIQQQHSSSASIKFRIKQGDCIWFTVSAHWGLEILRGMVTPKGVTLLNHMEHAYCTYDYATLQVLWPGPWDYKLLQSLLLGESVAIDTLHEVLQDDQQVCIQQQQGVWHLTYFMHAILKRVNKLVAKTMHRSLIIIYQHMLDHQISLFKQVTWLCHDHDAFMQVRLQLKNVRVQWPKQALSFPFFIPKSYEEKQAIPNIV